MKRPATLDSLHRTSSCDQQTSRLRLLVLAAACATLASCDSSANPAEPTGAQHTVDVATLTSWDVAQPDGDPPPAWIDNPVSLGPDMPQSASNCDLVTFPFPATVQPYRHPDAVCRQREWGSSGIVRQQGRGLHVTTLPKCNGQPGDITEIRLCKIGWANQQTTWGKAGPLGCVAITLSSTCEV